MAKKQIFSIVVASVFVMLAIVPSRVVAASAWTGTSYGVVEARQNARQYDIIFNRLDPAGKKLQMETSVLSAGVPVRFPTVHWTETTFMVFWTQEDWGGTLIAARRIDAIGIVTGPIIFIHRSDYPITSFETAYVEQNPHHFALSWGEKLSTNQSRSMFLRVDTAGAKLAEPVVVDETKPAPPLPQSVPVLQPGPTVARLEQLQRAPASGQPPYPSAMGGTAQSIESRPGSLAYAYPPSTTTPIALPSPFQPVTTEASTIPTPFYAYSPAPMFGPRVVAQVPTTTPITENTAQLQTTPMVTVTTTQLHSGDLVRGATPSVWQYGDDGKRHLFPDDFTFKSWSNKYEWVINTSQSDLLQIQEGAPILIYPGYSIIAFKNDLNLYMVRRIGVLTRISGPAEAQQRYGKNWKQRIHTYPRELKARYQFETVKAVAKKTTTQIKQATKKKTITNITTPKQDAVKTTPKTAPKGRTGQTVFQPINVRSRNVL